MHQSSTRRAHAFRLWIAKVKESTLREDSGRYSPCLFLCALRVTSFRRSCCFLVAAIALLSFDARRRAANSASPIPCPWPCFLMKGPPESAFIPGVRIGGGMSSDGLYTSSSLSAPTPHLWNVPLVGVKGENGSGCGSSGGAKEISITGTGEDGTSSMLKTSTPHELRRKTSRRRM